MKLYSARQFERNAASRPPCKTVLIQDRQDRHLKPAKFQSVRQSTVAPRQLTPVRKAAVQVYTVKTTFMLYRILTVKLKHSAVSVKILTCNEKTITDIRHMLKVL